MAQTIILLLLLVFFFFWIQEIEELRENLENKTVKKSISPSLNVWMNWAVKWNSETYLLAYEAQQLEENLQMSLYA